MQFFFACGRLARKPIIILYYDDRVFTAKFPFMGDADS
jgi:hypothetical protein